MPRQAPALWVCEMLPALNQLIVGALTSDTPQGLWSVAARSAWPRLGEFCSWSVTRETWAFFGGAPPFSGSDRGARRNQRSGSAQEEVTFDVMKCEVKHTTKNLTITSLFVVTLCGLSQRCFAR